jgi:hypothetical protein
VPSYQPADDELDALVKDAMELYRPDLASAGVQVKTLLAFPTDKDMEAHAEGGADLPTPTVLKHHGYPALAVIAVNSPKKRAEGCLDATLTLDGDAWVAMSDAQKEALLHHELLHLLLQISETGALLTDDLSRPKLKIRPHDLQLGLFYEVARRHGTASVDFQEARDVSRRYAAGEFDKGYGAEGGAPSSVEFSSQVLNKLREMTVDGLEIEVRSGLTPENV